MSLPPSSGLNHFTSAWDKSGIRRRSARVARILYNGNFTGYRLIYHNEIRNRTLAIMIELSIVTRMIDDTCFS